MSHHGSCLCGAVRYRLAGRIEGATLCHCRMCRKASGSAYAANATVRAGDFELLSGAGELREYESTPGKLRAFCGHCGSPIYARYSERPTELRLRLGSLDSTLRDKPVAHVFAGAEDAWHCVDDGLPRYPARIPEDD